MVGEVCEYDELAGLFQKIDTVRITTSVDEVTGEGKNSLNSHFWTIKNYFFSVKIWENAPHGIAQKRTSAIFDISSGSWDKFLEFF